MSMVGWFDPITRKRLQRFRDYRRAWYSLLIILILYLTSLVAEVFCNDRPLYIRYENESYFPVLFFYPEDTFTGNGLLTRPDYKTINASPTFTGNEDNFMIFPPVPFGPQEIIKASSIPVDNQVEIHVQREPRVASINIDTDNTIRRQQRAEWFFRQAGKAIDAPVEGLNFHSFYAVSAPFIEALELRFADQPAGPYSQALTAGPEGLQVELSLSPYKPRSRKPDTVRVLLREAFRENLVENWLYSPEDGQISAHSDLWEDLAAERRDDILARAAARMAAPVGDLRLEHDGNNYRIKFTREDVRFPFRPVGPHLFGLDDSGRDVLARIFYGLRTSLNFGLLLVITSMVIGTMIGAIQGYYGGKIDLTGQRLTEIWEALPFLYVLILLGSVYGSSFILVAHRLRPVQLDRHLLLHARRIPAPAQPAVRRSCPVPGIAGPEDPVPAHPAQCAGAVDDVLPFLPGGRHRHPGGAGLPGIWPAPSHRQLGTTVGASTGTGVLVADPVPEPGPVPGHPAVRLCRRGGAQCLRPQEVYAAGVTGP